MHDAVPAHTLPRPPPILPASSLILGGDRTELRRPRRRPDRGAGRAGHHQPHTGRRGAAGFCRFSVGGSTHGQALALAVTGPGRPVVVPRTLHRSLLLGLVLSGPVPVWVRPEVDPSLGLPLGVTAGQVREALGRDPGATAVFTGDASYVGTVGEIAAIAQVAHRHGVPLVVDAAWGAHFGLHPRLPAHAVALGAEALMTSVHKTLPGLNQAALVLARTDLIDAGRLDAAVEATATTSPSGTILASIDATRALLARDGEHLLGLLLARVQRACTALAEIEGARVLTGDRVDPAKLVVVLPGTGADGNAVERDLLEAGMPVEMADRDTVVPMVTLADTDREIDALAAAIARHRGTPRRPAGSAAWSVTPVIDCSPREAYFAEHRTVPAAQAVGMTRAERWRRTHRVSRSSPPVRGHRRGPGGAVGRAAQRHPDGLRRRSHPGDAARGPLTHCPPATTTRTGRGARPERTGRAPGDSGGASPQRVAVPSV